MDTGDYCFADLHLREDLVKEIISLENKMKSELGEDVTLIAYSKDQIQQKRNG